MVHLQKASQTHTVERPSSVCQTCWDTVFSMQFGLLSKPLLRTGTNEWPRGGLTYTSTLEDIKSGAISECQWCKFMLGLIQEDTRRAGSGPVHIIMGIRAQSGYLGAPKYTQALSIYINNIESFDGYLYADADNPAAEHITARSRIVDVGSPQSISLCRKQLEECIVSHEHCPPISKPYPLLPTRLIDCSNPKHLKLVKTSGMQGSYCTLSYVWGEPQPHRTTKENFGAYTKKIDSAHLPKTILDAIHITRLLGIQYLWVDSICIIQDSEEDKLVEITRMGHIYRHSYLTIVAACSPRDGAGFLGPRPPVPPSQFPRDTEFPFPCFPNQGGTALPPVIGKVKMSPIAFYTELDDSFDKWSDYFPAMEPVNERAWCLQEYAMSPRSLVFTYHTVQFHCITGGAQNVGGSYNSHPDREDLLPQNFFFSDFVKTSGMPVRGSQEWVSVRRAWNAVLREYTRRSITNAEDTFVAFAGIAQVFQTVLGGDYLAGLWRNTLLSDLLWFKFADMDMARPKIYRAPSWSWASVEGAIVPGKLFDRELHATETLAEVISCTVLLRYPEHPFGETKEGTLLLRARLEECRWNIRSSKFIYHKRTTQSNTDDSNQKIIGTGYIDSKDDQDVHDVYAIPIYMDKDEVEGSIIVAKLSDGDKESGMIGKYRRIGYFDSHRMECSTNWLKLAPVVEVIIV
ncbi:hypothetical protein JR316_0011219 [Psilocybe cubensis]|uniref:Uncharacterized protein n=2 Tax=Psilocybe cubensis TaxID=181762 RepID=A0ACB8GIW0_PSICU|nr:hypothetical protein JR316_0011219 [Psilocybe cubensis]KAH9475660.1 hypothetical protein JR316_0011219 [Psilocybe cubensis]